VTVCRDKRPVDTRWSIVDDTRSTLHQSSTPKPDIGRKSSEYCHKIWYGKIGLEEESEDTITGYDTTHEHDGQMDRETDRNRTTA